MILKGKTAAASLRSHASEGREISAETTPLSPGEGFPAVLAPASLAAMIDLMENAAGRVMKPHLRAQESSVAVEFEIGRIVVSAAPPVRAVAIHRGVAGRVHRFTLHVFAESGLIASAEHTRAVVVEKRLLGLARRRAGRPSMLLGA